MTAIYAALEDYDMDAMKKISTEILAGIMSFYDYIESYYHGFRAGIFCGNGKFQVISNRKSALVDTLLCSVHTASGGEDVFDGAQSGRQPKNMENHGFVRL